MPRLTFLKKWWSQRTSRRKRGILIIKVSRRGWKEWIRVEAIKAGNEILKVQPLGNRGFSKYVQDLIQIMMSSWRRMKCLNKLAVTSSKISSRNHWTSKHRTKCKSQDKRNGKKLLNLTEFWRRKENSRACWGWQLNLISCTISI